MQLPISAEAIMRAAGLLRALGADDQQHWEDVLASEQDDEGPYGTFSAMAMLADRLADSVSQLSGDSVNEVLTRHTEAMVSLYQQLDE